MGIWDRRGRQSPPPAPPQAPDGLAMVVEDVFWIGAPADARLRGAQRKLAAAAPGTVLLGVLAGTGALQPGDLVVHHAGRFPVKAIEAFRELLATAQAPQAVGLRMGADVPRHLFSAGDQLRFERPGYPGA